MFALLCCLLARLLVAGPAPAADQAAIERAIPQRPAAVSEPDAPGQDGRPCELEVFELEDEDEQKKRRGGSRAVIATAPASIAGADSTLRAPADAALAHRQWRPASASARGPPTR